MCFREQKAPRTQAWTGTEVFVALWQGSSVLGGSEIAKRYLRGLPLTLHRGSCQAACVQGPGTGGSWPAGSQGRPQRGVGVCSPLSAISLHGSAQRSWQVDALLLALTLGTLLWQISREPTHKQSCLPSEPCSGLPPECRCSSAQKLPAPPIGR